MVDQKINISVALATYNGSVYLEDQLNSIINQTVAPTEVIISDDGSSDNSVALARSLLRASKLRFEIITHKSNSGFSSNFNSALMNTKGDIVFLCDQDDVWLPNKIEAFIKNVNYDDLFLIMSDMKVVDRDLNIILESFLDSAKIDLSEYTYGCTMALGRRLLNIALPVPHEVVQHDVWLNMFANILNAKKILPDQTLLYRRHEKNFTANLVGEREGFFEIISNAKQFHSRMLDRNMALSIALERIKIAHVAGDLGEGLSNEAQLRLSRDLLIAGARSSGNTLSRLLNPLYYTRLYAELGVSRRHLIKDTILLNRILQGNIAKRW